MLAMKQIRQGLVIFFMINRLIDWLISDAGMKKKKSRKGTKAQLEKTLDISGLERKECSWSVG